MIETDRKMVIAREMVDRVKGKHHPYNYLQWLAQCIYRGKEWESYFIAVNLLKAEGVENAKRKSLTALSKEQRKVLRNTAKKLAKLLQKWLELPVEVTRQPFKTRGDGSVDLQVAIQYSSHSQSFVYPTAETLERFGSMSEDEQSLAAYKMAQYLKPREKSFQDNLETIKASLECLL